MPARRDGFFSVKERRVKFILVCANEKLYDQRLECQNENLINLNF